MRNTLSRTMTISALALMVGTGVGQAQNDPQQQSSPSQSQKQDQQSQTQESSKQDLKISPEERLQQVSDINKASKFIGMRVRNKHNQDLGKINDVVIDLPSGKIAYAAMSVGGMLGVGDKLVAVPIEAFTPDQGQKGLVLDIDQQKLKQAPGFSQNNWPDLNAAQSGKTIGIATKGQQSQSTGASGSSSQQQSGSSQSDQQQQSQQDQQQNQPQQDQQKQPDQPQSPQ
jgi:sporulation protein YlmC with PRC-barrel domain